MISPGKWVLDYINVDGVRVLDDNTLEIELPKKFPGLLGLLSMPYFSLFRMRLLLSMEIIFHSIQSVQDPLNLKNGKKMKN